MKGRNFSVNIQRAKYVATDFVMVSIAFFVFNIFRFTLLNYVHDDYHTLWNYLGSDKLILEQILVPSCLMGIFWLSGYYNRPFNKSRVSEFSATFWSVLTSTALIFLILLINDSTGMKSKDYKMILVLFALLMTMIYAGRWTLTTITLQRLRKRKWIYSTLIIGNSRRSREVYEKLKRSGSVWAYNVVGFIRIDGEKDMQDDLPVWSWDDVERICAEKDIDQIILAPDKIRDAKIMHILTRLFPLDRPVKIAPDTLSYITANIHMNDILGIPFIDLTSPRISEFQKNVKRSFDVTASFLSLLLLSPVLLATAIAVKLSSPGPVIYSQERMGKGRRPFRIHKFRSMRADAEKDGPQLSSADDDRITRVGRFMRKYRIDELPQFWNVLKGEMSIVGPRPEREYYIDRIMKKAPYYGLIFQVYPGITSWGMVKYGYASEVSEMVERSRYDLIYLNNMSVSTDIKIMIYTVRTVVTGKGV